MKLTILDTVEALQLLSELPTRNRGPAPARTRRTPCCTARAGRNPGMLEATLEQRGCRKESANRRSGTAEPNVQPMGGTPRLARAQMPKQNTLSLSRPWVGHLVRPMSNPWAGPATSPRPDAQTNHIISLPPRGSTPGALCAQPTHGRCSATSPRPDAQTNHIISLPPMGWTPGSPYVQPMGGAPRLARTQVPKRITSSLSRPCVGQAGAASLKRIA